MVQLLIGPPHADHSEGHAQPGKKGGVREYSKLWHHVQYAGAQLKTCVLAQSKAEDGVFLPSCDGSVLQ